MPNIPGMPTTPPLPTFTTTVVNETAGAVSPPKDFTTMQGVTSVEIPFNVPQSHVVTTPIDLVARHAAHHRQRESATEHVFLYVRSATKPIARRLDGPYVYSNNKPVTSILLLSMPFCFITKQIEMTKVK